MSASDLIPEPFADLLRQVRGAGDVEFWTVGDVAAELEGDVEGNPEKLRLLRNSIADLAGVLPSTVGEYKAAALFYPPLVREAFPTLTRWHFRHAKRSRTGSAAFGWLVLAESGDDYGGNPMPVRVLAAKMGRADTAPALDALLDRAVSLLDRAAGIDLAHTLTRLWAWRDGAVEKTP